MKVWMLETSSHLRTYLAWCICLEKQLVFHFKWAIKPHQQSFFFCGRKVIEVQTALRSWSGTSWAWSWSVRPPSGQGLVLLSSASRVGDFGWWKHVGFRCWHSSMMESCEGVRLVSMTSDFVWRASGQCFCEGDRLIHLKTSHAWSGWDVFFIPLTALELPQARVWMVRFGQNGPKMSLKFKIQEQSWVLQ